MTPDMVIVAQGSDVAHGPLVNITLLNVFLSFIWKQTLLFTAHPICSFFNKYCAALYVCFII